MKYVAMAYGVAAVIFAGYSIALSLRLKKAEELLEERREQ